MVGWRARLGFLVPAGTPTVEPEMYGMAPEGVSVHFHRMVGRGALWTGEDIKTMAAFLGTDFGPSVPRVKPTAR